MKQSDLEYLGKLDGRHSWSFGEECFYWTNGDNVVTRDLAGTIRFCAVTLPPRQNGGPRTIRALTRTDAKRAIVEALGV
ncbi:hypothetical protein F3H81_21105 [Aeromonas veronii]|jgi:hypothetical protein|nr:hypothetical protein [Aeromonas veronii]